MMFESPAIGSSLIREVLLNDNTRVECTAKNLAFQLLISGLMCLRTGPVEARTTKDVGMTRWR